MKNVIIIPMFLFTVASGCAQEAKQSVNQLDATADQEPTIVKTEAEWKKTLTPEQYYVLREQGTEYAFSGKYFDHKDKGVYTCAACDNELFNSETKYRSGTGWPSFWQALSESVGTRPEPSYGYGTLEVHCAQCGGHLGHIFKDGPRPTGLRYCINSISLNFKPK